MPALDKIRWTLDVAPGKPAATSGLTTTSLVFFELGFLFSTQNPLRLQYKYTVFSALKNFNRHAFIYAFSL